MVVAEGCPLRFRFRRFAERAPLSLNYDELVVCDERRVLPVGLILYSGGK